MGKRVIRLTESNLKKFIRKIISEQHIQRINENNISDNFELVHKIKGNDSYKLLKHKSDNLFGVLYTDDYTWVFEPNYTETNVSFDENTDTIITKYTNSDGDSFYTLYDMDVNNNMEIPEVRIVSNEETLNNMGFNIFI